DAQQDGGEFVVGDLLEGTLEEGGTWAATMTVEETGLTVIDGIRGEGDPDLTLTLLDSSGTEIASNDDRGGQLTSLIGGHNFDPYLAPWLEAGEYTVIVGTYADRDSGGFELYTVQVNDIEIAEEQVAELEENPYVARALVVEEAGDYTISATAEEWEAAIALFESDGASYTLEDPHSDEAEITATLEPGGYLFIIADPGGEPDTFTFVVEGP